MRSGKTIQAKNLMDNYNKLSAVARKHFPGPDDNPSLRYKRNELVRDCLDALGLDSSQAVVTYTGRDKKKSA